MLDTQLVLTIYNDQKDQAYQDWLDAVRNYQTDFNIQAGLITTHVANAAAALTAILAAMPEYATAAVAAGASQAAIDATSVITAATGIFPAVYGYLVDPSPDNYTTLEAGVGSIGSAAASFTADLAGGPIVGIANAMIQPPSPWPSTPPRRSKRPWLRSRRSWAAWPTHRTSTTGVSPT